MLHSTHTHITCWRGAQLEVGLPCGECFLALDFELQPVELSSHSQYAHAADVVLTHHYLTCVSSLQLLQHHSPPNPYYIRHPTQPQDP